tara:strand:+ start:1655 stop:2161 length:507 start_codon:yes stop_codon:yes gene_type:complete
VSQKESYSYDDLIDCGKGKVFGKNNAQLPLPPMLMFDRISKITELDGAYNKGQIVAEMDINPELWFFDCHFYDDPVMPGCLGLDALWQLSGFYLAWLGNPGRGRALGAKEIKFTGQVTPKNKLITYQIDVKQVFSKKTKLIIADGTMSCDGETIYVAKNLKVGLFETL